ncbi:putative RNA-directed DNA polymerase [Helianthus annuus]|nr:putative RNA-directed DNA polymerase [Helianthus annuus]
MSSMSKGTKDETAEMLIDLFTKLENVHEARIKRIRSDNGTEFKKRILDLYCLRKGIEYQYSAPYTPQQNGVAERKHRTLIEAARTMLSDSKLPVLFWGEAVNIACYVLNKVLIVERFNKTCHELMFNEKLHLTCFEPFGLPCTIVRNKDKQKFVEMADEGYFLGYVPGTPNKRGFNLKTGKIEVILMLKLLHTNLKNQRVVQLYYMFMKVFLNHLIFLSFQMHLLSVDSNSDP